MHALSCSFTPILAEIRAFGSAIIVKIKWTKLGSIHENVENRRECQVPVRASSLTYFGVSDPAGRTRLMTDQEGSGDRKCNAGPAEHEAPAGMAGSNIASGGSSKGRIGSYPHHQDHLCKGLPLLIPVYGYHATPYKLY